MITIIISILINNCYHLSVNDKQKLRPSLAERSPYRSEDLFVAARYLVRISLLLRVIRNRYSSPPCKNASFIATRPRAAVPFERIHICLLPSALAQGSQLTITE
jgi:hypothetical protein